MKAVKLTGIKKMEAMDVPIPEIINSDDVLIKMGVVGVCGSDIHYYDTGRIGVQIVEYPFAVGHEGAGVVEKIGSAVKNVKPGDRIVIEPSISCGECEQCKAGRPHTCLNNKFLGCPGQIEGNLVDFIIMPESQCLKLDDNQTLDDGALSEPLAIGLYANKQANTQGGEDVAILGYGPIGMSVMLMAQARGVENFIVSEKIDARLKLAAETGAELALNPDVLDVSQELKNQGKSVDIVFECCGKQEALDTAIDIVKPGGKIVIVGIPEFDRWTFTADLARRKEITLIHVRRQNHCTEETLQMMKEGKVDASKMVTHRFSFNDTDKAFEMVSNYKDGVMKAMIDF